MSDLTSYDFPCFYLKDKFQFLRYDCAGHGKSPAPSHIYHLDDHVLDLELLVEKFKLEKIVFIGMSNGARIAMEFARRHPENVQAVVAIGTYDIPTPMVQAKVGSWIAATKLGGYTARFDTAIPWIWGETFFNEKSEHILAYRKKGSTFNEDSAEFLMEGARLTSIDVGEIQCPILFLAGEEDVLTPAYVHARMSKKAVNSTFKLVEGGHACLIEKPAIMENVILPWLNDTIF